MTTATRAIPVSYPLRGRIRRVARAADELDPISAWVMTAFTLLSLIWHSTFTLPAWASIAAPGLGTIVPPDLATLGMFAVWVLAQPRRLDGLDLAAVGAGVWILVAGLANVFVTESIDLQHFLRYTARLAPYWFALPLMRRLPARHWKWVLAGGGIIGGAVALLHTYIVLTRNVPLMLTLYYQWSARGFEGLQNMQAALAGPSGFVAGAVPDGIGLVVSVYAACLGAMAARKTGFPLMLVVAAGLCGVAAMVTLERSLGMLLLGVLPVMAMWRTRPAGRALRLGAAPLVLTLLFAGVAALVRPDLPRLYIDRFESLFDELDPGNDRNSRRQDTLQGSREIMETPLIGTGLPNPRDAVRGAGGDAHGLVLIGLIGGLPLVFLVLKAVYDCTRLALSRATPLTTAGLFVLAGTMFLMMINTAPGFVWNRTLVPTVVGMAMASSLGERRSGSRID